MEIVLLMVLLIYLFVSINGINTKLKNNEDLLVKLQKKIDLLSKKKLSDENQEIQPNTKLVERQEKISETASKPLIEEQKPIFPINSISIIEDSKPKPTLIDSKPEVTFTTPKPVEKKPIIAKKSWWETFKEKNPDLEKFIGENLINKIGVLILVLGISYFVKYSIDKGWIPVEARVGIGMLSGALVMGVAHKLRQKYAAFSSVFVAGAIAIFYFTIAIGFHDYKLFNQITAFVIMVIITLFSCLISLSYNRKELAVLSLIGGFAVPFMVSTGAGSYVVLFTYIIILNLGILAIAYYKKWTIINILSFIFTIILFGGWLIKDLSFENKTPHYLGALIFGFLFYLIFVLMNVANVIRTKGVFSNLELAILSSNTFLFYAVGMAVLSNYHPELRGLFTTVLGLINLIYAWILFKKYGLDKRGVYLLIGLTLTFITLAIPIQFKGNYITLFWSAEAVLLMWLGQKSNMNAYKLGSFIVTILMLVSLILDWDAIYTEDLNLNILWNKIFITGLFSIISLVLLRIIVKKEIEKSEVNTINIDPLSYLKFLGFTIVLLSYIVGFLEVNYQTNLRMLSYNAGAAIVVLYHLVFSGFLFYFLTKRNNENSNYGAVLLGVFNIILFVFWFSNYAFYENREILFGNFMPKVAFYIHYISLAIIVYFGVVIYQLNKQNKGLKFLKNNKITWVVVFLIVYLASTELMLHGIVFSTNPISLNEIKTNKLFVEYNRDVQAVKETLVNDSIFKIKNLIIRTGFPILWGVLAFVFLIFGIKQKNKILRIIALSLLGITIVKLFLFDIKNASETGKIIAFILLGVLILIISFVYQKIKLLIVEEKTENQN